MVIEKPIFIIGTGRCGSTIFHEIFSYHPNVSFLTGLCDSYPEKLWLNRMLIRTIDIPILRYISRKKSIPSEAWDFWQHYDKSFGRPCRDLLKEDVTNKTESIIRKAMSEIPTKKRNRLLIKITGWPRMGYLKKIFPDAKFIHVLRDGRAVANSLLNVDFWWGWGGPQNWRWGEFTPNQKEEWEKYGQSFVVLAGILWKLLLDALEEAKQTIEPADFLEIKYEDLCWQPIETFLLVAKFCELQWSSGFESVIRSSRLKNTNSKWQEELTDYQKKILNECLRDYLEKYGYQI